MNIADDYDYLNNSTYFNKNINKLFLLDSATQLEHVNTVQSRNNKVKISVHDSIANVEMNDISILTDDIQDVLEMDSEEPCIVILDEIETINTNTDTLIESVFINKNTMNDTESTAYDSSSTEDEVYDDTTENGDENWETESSMDDDTSTECEMTDDAEQNVYIEKFPVQMICLEKCEDTFDSLFENNEIDCNEGVAALLQVVFILHAYKTAFAFTHNDLHTNNIMYKSTEKEFLYYKCKNQFYKVPTYGKIYKIIDFGRSIYTFNGKLLCSDSFSPIGDATTQYNFEPYYNPKKPRIEPNYSFDLCRLGCSIYDFIIEDDMKMEDADELQQLIITWCTDDSGRNILYKKNGDERYPNFKLYKMIARTAHDHTTDAQFLNPIFKKFEVNVVEESDTAFYIDIDSIPSYVDDPCAMKVDE
jgi:hypothetical protein